MERFPTSSIDEFYHSSRRNSKKCRCAERRTPPGEFEVWFLSFCIESVLGHRLAEGSLRSMKHTNQSGVLKKTTKKTTTTTDE
eukprot:scaffold101356_cov42-Attheya_sp.AAC.3